MQGWQKTGLCEQALQMSRTSTMWWIPELRSGKERTWMFPAGCSGMSMWAVVVVVVVVVVVLIPSFFPSFLPSFLPSFIHYFYHYFILAGCSGNGVAVALPDCGSRCACSVRWTGTCCERRRPWRNWGDPHLETLDGKKLSFHTFTFQALSNLFYLIHVSPYRSTETILNLTNVVSFLCVCPLIDDKFRHNIVKVGSTTNLDKVITKFIINKRTDAKTDVNLVFFCNNRKPKLIFKRWRKEMQESMEDSIAAESEFHRCNSENHRLVN